jgi:hypothetical protein
MRDDVGRDSRSPHCHTLTSTRSPSSILFSYIHHLLVPHTCFDTRYSVCIREPRKCSPKMYAHPALDPATHLIPALKSSWPTIYSHFTKNGLLKLSSWTSFYRDADVMHSCVMLIILFTIYVYVMQQLTGNASQVDGLWTFLPGKQYTRVDRPARSSDIFNPHSYLLRTLHLAEVHRHGRQSAHSDGRPVWQAQSFLSLGHDRASIGFGFGP